MSEVIGPPLPVPGWNKISEWWSHRLAAPCVPRGRWGDEPMAKTSRPTTASLAYRRRRRGAGEAWGALALCQMLRFPPRRIVSSVVHSAAE